MEKIELLAPSGDLNRLKIAILYGADAIYIGGKDFNLRSNAINFTIDEIREACTFAHKYDKKVYLTLNIFFHNEDTENIEEYIKEVVGCKIDAFIVSDPYIISYIKENFPSVEVHLSTQNSTTNYKAVEYFKNERVDRVVLARELSKDEIKEIIDKTGIDIEVFIHGAMCTCLSGRCALSNYITKRDANRGGCAQVCRFNLETNEEKDFTMASKDLNMTTYIKDLIEIGVKSLKIEGRMRSPYYIATVISTYRKIIDSYYDNSLTEEKLAEYNERLKVVANRASSTHFFTKEADEADQYFSGRNEFSNQDYLGLIIDYDNTNRCLVLKERNYFKVGDKVEIFTPDFKFYNYTVEKIYDENMNSLEVARHPEQILKLPFKESLPPYSMIRMLERK